MEQTDRNTTALTRTASGATPAAPDAVRPPSQPAPAPGVAPATGLAARLSALARVPEHSLPLMTALSQGEPFCAGDYLFVAAEDWLMAVGYPLEGRYTHQAFEAALDEALRRSGATACWAIGPELPPRLAAHALDRDRYYVLSARASVPRRLRGPLARAAQALRVSEGTEFTPGHRRLWAEFLGRVQRGEAGRMAPHVAALYARTPEALAAAGGGLRLLDARDAEGRLAACLLLDYAPARFTSYILGAHSRARYAPHAADLLFAAMLERARTAGKRYIHLGLGVNEGILRFKRKWGAVPSWPYVMAQWTEARRPARAGRDKGAGAAPSAARAESDTADAVRAVALALLRAPDAGGGKAALLGESPSRRPFAMLWRLEKAGRVSWIGGTAHFFCHSFEGSFRRLFRQVDHVLFEGPLDEGFMAEVDRAGRTPLPGATPLLDLLGEDEIRRLERVVRGPEGRLWRALGMESRRKPDVRWFLANARPWCAFFSLWTAFLERRGWRDSVDMEAWRVARDMGRNVVGMESLEEQLDSLSSLPVERVLRFFRACGGWAAMSRRNMRAYLAGDLEAMMGSSAEFPTRTEYVISRRDQRFRERMRPYLEEGRCAVFVGSAHMVNLRRMLAEDGFTVRQTPFGLVPRLRLGWRRLRRAEDVAW